MYKCATIVRRCASGPVAHTNIRLLLQCLGGLGVVGDVVDAVAGVEEVGGKCTLLCHPAACRNEAAVALCQRCSHYVAVYHSTA